MDERLNALQQRVETVEQNMFNLVEHFTKAAQFVFGGIYTPTKVEQPKIEQPAALAPSAAAPAPPAVPAALEAASVLPLAAAVNPQPLAQPVTAMMVGELCGAKAAMGFANEIKTILARYNAKIVPEVPPEQLGAVYSELSRLGV